MQRSIDFGREVDEICTGIANMRRVQVPSVTVAETG